MTAVLLALLLAQPAPDEAAHVEQHLAAQLREANRLLGDDPEEAMRLLNGLLDDPKGQELEGRSPTVRAYREQALFVRGWLHLQQGQAQAAADEMTVLLDRKRRIFLVRIAGLVGAMASPQHTPLSAGLCFPPTAPLGRADWFQALRLRAAAYKKLGQHDREQADRAEAAKVMREMRQGMPVRPDRPPSGWLGWLAVSWDRWLWRPISWITRPLFVAAAFVVMVPVFLLMGLRQRRDAGGSWGRLVWVALALAALQSAPLLAAFLLLRWRPWFLYGVALPYVTYLVFGINIMRHRAYLTAVRWQRARAAPPLLEDATVLSRIAWIAGRMGIAPPVTRLVRSASSLQVNNALIAGLAAPTMVLFDGLLYRLTEEERDAIIAHELAHLANHTFWYWLVAGAGCGIACVAASAFYPIYVAVCLGLALLIGAWLILSRWLELDSDRRAARAIGHRRAASALWKIHADQQSPGLVEFLFGAVGTHPSRDERLAAIRRDAPKDDMPEVEWDWRVLRRRRLAAWSAAGLWLAVIIGCLLWGYRSPRSNWPALPLVLMVVALLVLFWLRQRKTARRQHRLQRTSPDWRRRLALLGSVLLLGFLAAHSFGLTAPYLSTQQFFATLGGGYLAWLVLALVGRNRVSKLNHQITIAIQSGDYPGALALCEGRPAVVAGSTLLRYNQAIIRAVLGRREEALSDLERLRHDDPRFKMTWLLLASVYADEGEYARALELATQLRHDLPGEPAGPQMESWLLRKVGRLEEAEARAREVLEMDSQSGAAHLTLAAVAFDRGDHAGAREQLARAERIMPGSTDAALLAAEMALAMEGADAEAAVLQAVNAARNNPLSFAAKEAACLAQRLEARRQASPSLES